MTRDFLNHFEVRQRGHIAHIFLEPVRAGLTDPRAIIEAVIEGLQEQSERCRWWGNDQTVERNDQIKKTIHAHPAEAVDFARWAIWWESLSDPEKRRIRAERWMSTQLATDKQVKYLRALDYTGDIESKLQASELIDKLLKEGRVFV